MDNLFFFFVFSQMAVASLGCNIANSGLNGDLSDASSPSEVRVVVKNLHSSKVAGVHHLWPEIEKCLHFFSIARISEKLG